MVNGINAPSFPQQAAPAAGPLARQSPGTAAIGAAGDRLELRTGSGLRVTDALDLVRERAYEQLRGVVEGARRDLGIPEGAIIDTSPEATAGRIVNFALGFFGRYAENNGLENDEAGRRQFAEFIGGAIGQGIDEARGILSAFQALSPEIAGNIDKTASIIAQRLEDFIQNGL